MHACTLLAAVEQACCDRGIAQVASVERLGRQAAQFIATSADPLAALVDLPGNFPSKAAALSRLPVSREARGSMSALKRMFPAGVRMAF